MRKKKKKRTRLGLKHKKSWCLIYMLFPCTNRYCDTDTIHFDL